MMVELSPGVYMPPWEARKQIGSEQKNKCVFCACSLTWDLKAKRLAKTCATLDHKIPLYRGGKTTLENLVVACHACNNERGSTPFEEFQRMKQK